MPGGRAGFFGGLIEGLGGAFVAKKQEQHKEEQEAIKRNFDAGMLLFDKGFEDIGADLLGTTISGFFGASPDGKPGKGKGKDGILGVLQNPKAVGGLLKGLHSGITKAGGPAEAAGGAAAAPQRSSPFRSRAETEQADEAKFEQRETFKTNEGIRSAQETGRYNKPSNWSTDTTKGSDLAKVKEDILGNAIDPAKSYKTRTLPDGTVEARPTEFSSAKAPKTDTSKLGQLSRRIKLLNPSLTDEAAQQQAAQRMESEDRLSAAQKTGRYNAFIKAAGTTEALKGERLKEAQTLFPYHVAAAGAKEDLDAFKMAVQGQKTAQNAQKAIAAAQKVAQGIVNKQSGFLQTLGLEPDRQSIEDGLLREAGQDPDELRKLATQAFKTPEKPASKTPPPGAITTPGGSFVPVAAAP